MQLDVERLKLYGSAQTSEGRVEVLAMKVQPQEVPKGLLSEGTEPLALLEDPCGSGKLLHEVVAVERDRPFQLLHRALRLAVDARTETRSRVALESVRVDLDRRREPVPPLAGIRSVQGPFGGASGSSSRRRRWTK